MKTRTQHLLAIVLWTLLFIPVVNGCDRPLRVDVDISGAEKLPLTGEQKVRGVLSRTVINGEFTFAKGTQIRVSETWLLRQKQSNPPGYRISGFYDPEIQRDGFVLPSGAVDIYLVGHPLESPRQTVIIPMDLFQAKQ
tara:strand:- start:132 stop:545 length:414 start_codon:yes stop_codon:yes gene_type:complete